MYRVISPFGDINYELFSTPEGENKIVMVFDDADTGDTIALHFHAASFVAVADNMTGPANALVEAERLGRKLPRRNHPFPYAD